MERLRDASVSVVEQLSEEQKAQLSAYYEALYRDAFEKQVCELMDRLEE